MERRKSLGLRRNSKTPSKTPTKSYSPLTMVTSPFELSNSILTEDKSIDNSKNVSLQQSTPASSIQRKRKRTSSSRKRKSSSSVFSTAGRKDRTVENNIHSPNIIQNNAPVMTFEEDVLNSETINNTDIDKIDETQLDTSFGTKQQCNVMNECFSSSSAELSNTFLTDFDATSNNLDRENTNKDILNQTIVLDESNLNESRLDTTIINKDGEYLISKSQLVQDDTMFAGLNLTEIVSSNNLEELSLEYDKNSFYGLPRKAHDVLKQNRGITKLYDWQNECLCLPAIFQRKNIVYSLPTSGGKTLVAEILMMKELLVSMKNVILVLPYVSIVQEKVRGLSPFAVDLGFHIEEYAASKGSMPPKRRRKKKSIYIATIEKANAIINSLIELERKDELGMVVVDEENDLFQDVDVKVQLHMIGDGGGRGALLEILLAKLLFGFSHVQIVGMSATLGNMNEIQKFLHAEIYTNNFRPVELTEYVKLKEQLYKLDSKCQTEDGFWKKEREICHHEGMHHSIKKRDPDHLLSLVMEVIPENSCLIFCATKKNCESVANMLADCLPKTQLEVKKNEREQLLQLIRNTVNGVCKTLMKTIPFGIAYHHSGLTMDERKLIEEAYGTGTLCLLCCTSTLAAGVNLPAKRVILRSPYVGCKFLSRSQYKQMIGRAGRAGIDTSGESVLILPLKDKERAKSLLDGPIGTCRSSLFFQDGKGLRQLILSLLSLKLCSSYEEIENFLRSTLYYVQNNTPDEQMDMIEIIQQAVEHLIKIELVIKTDLEGSTFTIETTNLGRATLKGCIDIDLAPFLYKQLLQAQRGLVLINELQLLYLATPLDQVETVQINWMTFYKKFGKLNPVEVKACEFIGIQESILCKRATGQRYSKASCDDFIYKRFYLTLMLFDLMRKQTIWQVAESYTVPRGFLQNLLASASSFNSLLIHFTEVRRICDDFQEKSMLEKTLASKFSRNFDLRTIPSTCRATYQGMELSGLWAFKLLFQALLDRLTNTNNLELSALLDIPGVKQARARQLFKSGYRTLQDLAYVEASKLCQEIEYLPRKQAQLIISSAKMLLQERIESLREEAEEISAKPQVETQLNDINADENR